MFNTVWTLWLSLSYAFYCKHNRLVTYVCKQRFFVSVPPEGKSEEVKEVIRTWTGNGVGRKMYVERQRDRATGKEQGLVKNKCLSI